MRRDDIRGWAVEWHSKNARDGERRVLMWEEERGFFWSRAKCRAYIDRHYGFIRLRPDLRAEPHGWFMPRAVRVVIKREKT